MNNRCPVTVLFSLEILDVYYTELPACIPLQVSLYCMLPIDLVAVKSTHQLKATSLPVEAEVFLFPSGWMLVVINL